MSDGNSVGRCVVAKETGDRGWGVKRVYLGSGWHLQLLDVVPLFLLDPVAALSLPALMALNELSEVVGLLCHANKLMLEQFSRGWPLIGASLAWEQEKKSRYE